MNKKSGIIVVTFIGILLVLLLLLLRTCNRPLREMPNVVHITVKAPCPTHLKTEDFDSEMYALSKVLNPGIDGFLLPILSLQRLDVADGNTNPDSSAFAISAPFSVVMKAKMLKGHVGSSKAMEAIVDEYFKQPSATDYKSFRDLALRAEGPQKLKCFDLSCLDLSNTTTEFVIRPNQKFDVDSTGKFFKSAALLHQRLNELVIERKIGPRDRIDVYYQSCGNGKAQSGDKDKDGVTDEKDKCPDQPGKKEFDGCPDTDYDLIPDNLDECDTEAGKRECKGCPCSVSSTDSDGDGVLDNKDRCPNEFGRLNGCPDGDGDGFTDNVDDCDDQYGKLRGCPDNDGDGFANHADDCVDEAGKVSGCPDGDKDGVPDHLDECPNEAGLTNNGGCPKSTTVQVSHDDSKALISFCTDNLQDLTWELSIEKDGKLQTLKSATESGWESQLERSDCCGNNGLTCYMFDYPNLWVQLNDFYTQPTKLMVRLVFKTRNGKAIKGGELFLTNARIICLSSTDCGFKIGE